MNFAVPPFGRKANDPRPFILTLEGAALACAVALLCYSIQRHSEAMFFAAAATIVASLVLGTYFGFQAGVRALKAELQFEMTETGLIASRKGHPTVRIELAKIAVIRESKGWLTVYSRAPFRRIGIPVEVSDFTTVRSRLAEFRAPLPAKAPSWNAVELLGAIGSGALLLWGPNLPVMLASSAALAFLSSHASVMLMTPKLRGGNRAPMFMLVAINWLAILALLGFKLHSLR